MGRSSFRFIQDPNQPDNRDIAVDQDLSQIKCVVRTNRFVGQQSAQRGAYLGIAAIRDLAKLITKLFRENSANRIALTGIVSLRPGIQFRPNRRFVVAAGCGSRNEARKQRKGANYQPNCSYIQLERHFPPKPAPGRLVHATVVKLVIPNGAYRNPMSPNKSSS